MIQHHTRRQLAKGVAWSAPIVLGGATVPAYAASQQCAQGTFTAPAPTTDSADATTSTWVVPAGVSKICFSILGAGGGRSFMAGMEGGSGALITGELQVTPGQVFSLIVAAGGAGDPAKPSAGGGGYGAGGSVTDTLTGNHKYATNNYSASGGGASALILGDKETGTPLVVAGGGGGGGFYTRWVMHHTGVQDHQWIIGGQRGAAGGASVTGGAVSARMVDYNISVNTLGGGGAISGTPGAGGQPGSLINRDTSGVQIVAHNKFPGNSGEKGFLARGGDSVTAYIEYLGYTEAIRSGAGGGGYGGGGSGSGTAVGSLADKSEATVVIAAPGGGGGNYVDKSILNANVQLGTNGGQQRYLRNPGAITITY